MKKIRLGLVAIVVTGFSITAFAYDTGRIVGSYVNNTKAAHPLTMQKVSAQTEVAGKKMTIIAANIG